MVTEEVADQDPPIDRFRSVAQLNMLHSLAAKLNALGDVEEIGAAITAELRTIIDYHNSRVYLLQPDGNTLMPVAFRGELFKDYEQETLEDLITPMGEGLTGHVAQTGRSLMTPNAQEVDFAIQIAGTDDIVESMLLVPMKLGDQVTGVIVLSSLGYGKFDEEDQRLLEVLASHAAVAFENAKLFQSARVAAETSRALLRLSQALTGSHTIGDILQQAVEAVPTLVTCVDRGRLRARGGDRPVQAGPHPGGRARRDALARVDRRHASRGGRGAADDGIGAVRWFRPRWPAGSPRSCGSRTSPGRS